MSSTSDGTRDPLVDNLLSALEWRLIGPHRGGRVVAVAGDVTDRQTFYFGACAGGVWKTTDGGTYWYNISDGFFETAAVGALAVSASDPNVIYAGMGETSIRNNVSHGDGVYKSVDGGRTWRNIGLRDTRHIGKIQIHPENPDIVYVAALGHAFGPNEERGVYRTTDGGETWAKILYKSERAGSHDISMDPNNPRILYAAIWQTRRYPWTLISGGEECGLWRSFDGGDTWEEISRKPGLPQGLLGKIGVAASPARAGRVWALIEAEDGAVFRSDDYGETWVRLSEQSLLRTRPWYYMHITADTQDPDTVYVQNYSFWKSIDAGKTFERIPTPHGDDHALWIDPNDNQRMIEGNDGGACVSFNGGMSWTTIYNQPTAQLYHVITDDQVPYRVYASQQDNTAISIPSASVDGAIHERDWYAPGGGESGYIAVKPDDPNIVVASGPAGRRAYNDIMTTYDHRTGHKWNTTVWPELYGWGVGAESLKYRLGWTFPILFSQHDPNVLYVCGNHLFKSTTLGANFEVVSPDLTRNDPDKLKPSGGPITRDNTGAEVYCQIFALAESPFRPELLWAGTDDGLVHISEDGGKSWRNITPPDLPEWALISIIDPSPHDEATAYLAATRYKLDDFQPYLYKTNDYGKTWTPITSGIPAHEFTRVIREDPQRRGLLYVGTETGIYVSFDDGGHWQRLGGNLPVVPIHDFVIKGDELVVATHGRSIWILDDLMPLREAQDQLHGDAHLFTPRPRTRFRTYGRFRGEASREAVNYGRVDTSVVSFTLDGSNTSWTDRDYLDAGTNPPDGAVMTWYQPEGGSDKVTITILDHQGNELRAYEDVPSRPGINHFFWNLRVPGADNVNAEGFTTWERPDGPVVLPGTYQVRLVIDERPLTRPFTLEPDPRILASHQDLQAQFDFLLQVRDALSRTNRTIDAVASLRDQAAHWEQRAKQAGHESVEKEARELQAELSDILPGLIDVNIEQAQLWPSGLHEKLNALFDSVDSADHAPPQQARDVLAKLSKDLDELAARYEHAAGETIVSLNAAIERTGMQYIDATEAPVLA